MKQTQMYVCRLEEFILVDVVTCSTSEISDWNGFTLVYIQSHE